MRSEYELEQEWSIDDVAKWNDILDALDQAEVQASREARKRAEQQQGRR